MTIRRAYSRFPPSSLAVKLRASCARPRLRSIMLEHASMKELHTGRDTQETGQVLGVDGMEEVAGARALSCEWRSVDGHAVISSWSCRLGSPSLGRKDPWIWPEVPEI